MAEGRQYSCHYCGQPVVTVPRGQPQDYCVLWSRDGKSFSFAHDRCVPADETTPMTQTEVTSAMRPMVDKVFDKLAKLVEKNRED